MTATTGAAVRRRESCRLCGSPDCALVFPLGRTALADAYVPADKLEDAQETYPLELFLCRSCGHLQLLDVVDPKLLFTKYIYTSAGSPGLVDHFRGYARELQRRVGEPRGGLAVDIGSNDGTLLRFLEDAGFEVLGIDPAEEIARRASEAGILTLPEFFTSRLAEEIRNDHGPASIVTANNVFAHADELGDVADGIAALLAPDGVFVFEVSYLLDLLRNLVFDYVYHEHLCYHAVEPLRSFLERYGMELIDVQRIPTKGGSIRAFAQVRGGPRPISASVDRLIDEERAAGLGREETFRAFAAQIAARREEVRRPLLQAKSEGAEIGGYGASATVTTLMYHFGLDEFVTFIVDDNADRQGLFSPGHHIPVLSPEALYERRPDYVVVLAWRFAELIIERHREYVVAGGRFLVPLPVVKLIDAHSAELAGSA